MSDGEQLPHLSAQLLTEQLVGSKVSYFDRGISMRDILPFDSLEDALRFKGNSRRATTETIIQVQLGIQLLCEYLGTETGAKSFAPSDLCLIMYDRLALPAGVEGVGSITPYVVGEGVVSLELEAGNIEAPEDHVLGGITLNVWEEGAQAASGFATEAVIGFGIGAVEEAPDDFVRRHLDAYAAAGEIMARVLNPPNAEPYLG